MENSVKEYHNMTCPQCGEDHRLDVTATVSVRLTSDGSASDEAQDSSHEWDENSPIVCVACGWSGIVADARAAVTPLPKAMSMLAQGAAILSALQTAEGFMAGFEDDETQEGMDEMLTEVRDAIALLAANPDVAAGEKLLAFAHLVARMKLDGEISGDGPGSEEPYVQDADDAISTLGDLIASARDIVRGLDLHIDSPAHGGVTTPEEFMAMWEAMNDAKRDGDNEAMEKCWDERGTWSMRELCVKITHAANAVWDAMDDAEHDEIGGFDWEFCPRFLALVDFTTLTMPTIEAARAALLPPAEEPRTVIHTACRHCGLDIEGHAPFPEGEWRDRGNNTQCNDGANKHAPVQP